MINQPAASLRPVLLPEEQLFTDPCCRKWLRLHLPVFNLMLHAGGVLHRAERGEGY